MSADGVVVPENEADAMIRSLGFDPDRFRTDGGAINHMKLAAAIKHPDDYAGLRIAKASDLLTKE